MDFTNAYETKIKEYSTIYNKVFTSGKVCGSETVSLEAGFTLSVTEYRWSAQDDSRELAASEQILTNENGDEVHRWKIYDDHTFSSFTQIFTHSDGKLYLIYKESLYGYSVLRLSDRKQLHYIPAENETFIMTDFHYCRSNDLAAAGGCYWAAPYDTAPLEFSDPLKEPRSLLSIRDITDPSYENESLEDLDFTAWQDGCLILTSDTSKEQLRFTAENIRKFLSV